MQPSVALRPGQATMACLLVVAAGALLSVDSAVPGGWLPGWAGAAVSVVGLLAMLLVAWRARALRTGLLLLFIAVLAAVALHGGVLASGS